MARPEKDALKKVGGEEYSMCELGIRSFKLQESSMKRTGGANS